MSIGLKANSDIYPTPPVNTLDLDEILIVYEAKIGAVTTAQSAFAQSAFAQAVTEKQELLQTVTDKIKSNLRYAEQAMNFSDDKLKAIGWGGRKEPTPLAAPGDQSRGHHQARRELDHSPVGKTRGWGQTRSLQGSVPGKGRGQLEERGHRHVHGDQTDRTATRQGTGILRRGRQQGRRRTDEQFGDGGALRENYELGITNWETAELTDGQYAALCDFAYNVGYGNFEQSTRRKRVNVRDYDDVPFQFRRWIKANGKIFPGLKVRREKEIALFFEEIGIPKGISSRGALTPIDIRLGE